MLPGISWIGKGTIFKSVECHAGIVWLVVKDGKSASNTAVKANSLLLLNKADTNKNCTFYCLAHFIVFCQVHTKELIFDKAHKWNYLPKMKNTQILFLLNADI